jgi:hypothetical protein
MQSFEMIIAILKKIPLSGPALLPSIFLAVMFTACGPEPEKSARVVPEEKKEQTKPMPVRRFDHDLFALKKAYGRRTVDSLNKAYHGFLQRFTAQVINIGDSTNPQYYRSLADFLADPYINSVARDADSVFKDMQIEEQSFGEAFQAYHYFFPGKKIPSIIAYTGGFNYQVGAWPSELGIGLEFYLGSKHRFYSLLGLPAYKQRVLSREYLVPDALRGWLISEFEAPDKTRKFIDQLIFEGKIQYLIDQLLPETEDSLRTAYSGRQLEWLKREEARIWAFFIDKKMLFKPISFETDKFINEGPFTPGMPRESPGRIGVWIGRQIVRTYMQKHPEKTPQQLMTTDASKILSQSGYKPL